MSMLLSRYFQAVDKSVLIKYKNLAHKKGENAFKEINTFVGKSDESRNFVCILRTTTTLHKVSFIDFHFLANFQT